MQVVGSLSALRLSACSSTGWSTIAVRGNGRGVGVRGKGRDNGRGNGRGSTGVSPCKGSNCNDSTCNGSTGSIDTARISSVRNGTSKAEATTVEATNGSTGSLDPARISSARSGTSTAEAAAVEATMAEVMVEVGFVTMPNKFPDCGPPQLKPLLQSKSFSSAVNLDLSLLLVVVPGAFWCIYGCI